VGVAEPFQMSPVHAFAKSARVGETTFVMVTAHYVVTAGDGDFSERCLLDVRRRRDSVY
jgi:hypothetical protein